MKEKGKRKIQIGLVLVFAFAVFTWLVMNVDVKPIGVNGTNVGFSSVNSAFHSLSDVNMTLYVITDWAGLVPVFTAFLFGVMGLVQLIKRKGITKVDADILVLGGYYIVVAAVYVMFEMITVNYRPVLIDGFMEKSYPSSTTLLVMCVMPTLAEQVSRRCRKSAVKTAVKVFVAAFSAFVVVGRLISGVHWLTDILAALIISTGLFFIYKGFVLIFTEKSDRRVDFGIR